ncbi:MAG TPA: 16S rRNA (guanine(527)-N(7))-methyltransferase RsmG [bacterium]|nr:16S rRNA (guanine(527)-N(7))-methyltransferase RsmG [bacterium]
MKTEELLKKGLKELNIQYSENQINAFMSYLSELKKWNKTYNLTALRNDNDIIVKHFLDSLLYLKTLPEGILKLADAGAGAGFPGIPLKLVRPELDLALIESSRKKAAFLRHIIRHLQLKEVNVLEERLERLGKEYENNYDIIVTRATFSIKDFLTMACPYVKKDGNLILSKGPKVTEELNESPDNERAVRKILKARLPFEEAQRNLVVLNCRGASDVGHRPL